MKDDVISRQDAIDALKEALNPSITKFVQAKLAIENLPSAQPDSKDLVEKIKNGITASDSNSEYFIGLRNGMRWCLSLIDEKEPIYESSAQPDVARDIATIIENEKDMRVILAQPEIIRCKDCKFYEGRPCGIVDWYNTADDFCSKGERRTNEFFTTD